MSGMLLNLSRSNFHKCFLGISQRDGLKYYISMVHQRLLLETVNNRYHSISVNTNESSANAPHSELSHIILESNRSSIKL